MITGEQALRPYLDMEKRCRDDGVLDMDAITDAGWMLHDPHRSAAPGPMN